MFNLLMKHTGKVDISLIANIGNADRGNFHDQECADPLVKAVSLFQCKKDINAYNLSQWP